MKKALVMHNSDNVAVGLVDLKAGERVEVDLGCSRLEITIQEHVPFGHKFALQALAAGERIIKYGQVIGQAGRVIRTGEHVHVHNLESLRARGDKA